MSLSGEIAALQQHLEELARAPDEELVARYTMQRPQRPPGFYWQLRWLAGRILRWLQSKGILFADPWPVCLGHAGASRDAKPLLVWAIGADRDTLREACCGISGLLDAIPGFAPVLVTDVADFSYFSRLGWLVEYLPRLAGQGEPYEERKLKYLAQLYRGAPVLPVSAGLKADQVSEFRRWLESGCQ